jgi:SAM-dependent methyltransferase
MAFIGDYRAENAEAIRADADAFDYVLCKEAYHHFPRPPIALYEMLRVARKAVVLIEPLDNVRLLDGVKRLIKRMLRGNVSQEFEPSGNYLYRLNVREIEKLMMAMGGEAVAFKGINDFYHATFVEQKLTRFGLASVVTRLGVLVQDVLAQCRVLGYGLGCVVVLKGVPATERLAELQRAGFSVHILPRNPYIK